MNIEFRKILDNAVKSGKINQDERISIETEYCYVQVYNPTGLTSFIKKIIAKLS